MSFSRYFCRIRYCKSSHILYGKQFRSHIIKMFLTQLCKFHLSWISFFIQKYRMFGMNRYILCVTVIWFKSGISQQKRIVKVYKFDYFVWRLICVQFRILFDLFRCRNFESFFLSNIDSFNSSSPMVYRQNVHSSFKNRSK